MENNNINFDMKYHLDFYIQDCESYLEKLKMYVSLKVGDKIIDYNNNLIATITFIGYTHYELSFMSNIKEIRSTKYNGLTTYQHNFNISKKYGPFWNHSSVNCFDFTSPIKLSNFTKLEDPELFGLLYGK